MEEDYDPLGITTNVPEPITITIWATLFFGIILYFIIKIFRPRYCDTCKISMKLKYDEENNEIIYTCPECESIKGTGIRGGTGD